MQLQQYHGPALRTVHTVQYTLMEQGSLSAPHHVWIGPSRWSRDPEVGILNRVDEKHLCLKWLLVDGPGNNNNGRRRCLLLELIKGVNEKLGNHGSCEGLSRKELVKRMLLDGCYIVYRFAKCPPKDNIPWWNHGGGHGLLHTMLVGPCCRLITNCACIMDRIRGVHNTTSRSDVEAAAAGSRQMQPLGASSGGGATAAAQAQPRVGGDLLARWLECRDTWCLVDNHVPYDVLDVINHLVYNAPEGVFGGASARILLQWWSMYYYVPPLQQQETNPPPPAVYYNVPRDTVQAAGDDANCLLIILAQLLKPQEKVHHCSSSSRSSSRCCCTGGAGPRSTSAIATRGSSPHRSTPRNGGSPCST